MAAVGAVVTVRASRGPAIVVPTDVLVEEEVTRGGEPAHGTGQSGGARCAAHQGPQQANLRHLQRHATCYSGASGVGQRATQCPNFSILGASDALTADSLLTLSTISAELSFRITSNMSILSALPSSVTSINARQLKNI